MLNVGPLHSLTSSPLAIKVHLGGMCLYSFSNSLECCVGNKYLPIIAVSFLSAAVGVLQAAGSNARYV